MTEEMHFWLRVEFGTVYLDRIPNLNPAEKKHFRYHVAYWHWFNTMFRMMDQRLVKELRAARNSFTLAEYKDAIDICMYCMKINAELIRVIMPPNKKRIIASAPISSRNRVGGEAHQLKLFEQ